MKRGIGYLALSLFFSGVAHAGSDTDSVTPERELAGQEVIRSTRFSEAPSNREERLPQDTESRDADSARHLRSNSAAAVEQHVDDTIRTHQALPADSGVTLEGELRTSEGLNTTFQLPAVIDAQE